MSILDQIPTDEKTKQDIEKLACTISGLQEETGQWVYWKTVAKRQEGSETVAIMLESLATLPEAEQFFNVARNGRAVSLTTQGNLLVRERRPQQLPLTEQVSSTVKRYAGRLRALRFQIQGVYHVGKVKKRHVHAVQVELGDALIPNESPVSIIPEGGGVRSSGRIVGQDAEHDILYISLDSIMMSYQLPAYLLIDRAFLLYELAKSISNLKEVPPLGKLLFEDESKGPYIAHNDSQRVAWMLSSLPTPWSRFLWGPPGAGKTYGLAFLMLQLLKSKPHEKILLLAPSNVAVDVALSELVKQLEVNGLGHMVEDRRILRYGYPRKSEILSRPELLGAREQAKISSQIKQLATTIQAGAKREDISESDLALKRAELFQLQEELKKLVRNHLQQCLVVATTTTLAYMPTSPIRNQLWDSVFVDEVTMVSPAISLYLSSLAQKRYLLSGDPRQLAPIYEEKRGAVDNETRHWIGNDVYDFAGLSVQDGENSRIQINDKRLTRITSQRRCIQDIWDPIKHLYEDVEIDVDEDLVGYLRTLLPLNGQGIAVVDTGQEGAICERMSKSWQNQKSAEMGVKIAEDLLREGGLQDDYFSIAMITPYRAQYKLLRQLLKEKNIHQRVEVGTIHQFQGSEADVVIFDMVDGRGRKKLGKLLREDMGTRLVNVAISRARGKLIVLADVSWCRNVMRRDDNTILWNVIVKTVK